jgi:hypothetical protein
MLRRRSTLATHFLVLTLSSGAVQTPGAEPAHAEESWSGAEATAISEWKNTEGKNYGRSLEKAFSKDHSATIGVCANEAQKPDLSTFTLLLRIDAAGVVETAMVKPATNVAVCLQGKIKGWKAIPPPHGGYWAKLDVKMKSEVPGGR